MTTAEGATEIQELTIELRDARCKTATPITVRAWADHGGFNFDVLDPRDGETTVMHAFVQLVDGKLECLEWWPPIGERVEPDNTHLLVDLNTLDEGG